MGASSMPRDGTVPPRARRLQALRWRWPIVLLVAVPVVIGGFVFTSQTPVQQSAQAVVSLVPEENADTSADLIQLAVPRYAVRLTAEPTLRKVASATGVSANDVSGAVSVVTSTESANITVLVHDTSAAQAVRIASAIVAEGVALGRADATVDVQVPGPAVALTPPILTSNRLLLLLTLGLGLGLGVVAALLLEGLKPRLHGIADAEQLAGERVRGFVPDSPSLGALGHERVSPNVAHAVGLLRTALAGPPSESDCQVVAVVAPARGVGASTVASLLTGSLAAGGRRVCLVDADLAAPSLATTFDLEPTPGLVEVLEDKARFDEAVREFVPEGATVVPTDAADSPGDRLTSGLRHVLTALRGERDFVIIDCAPILGEDDAAAVVVTHADGVLLVIDPRTSRQDLNDAVSVLRYLDAPVLGLVVNRCDGRAAWSPGATRPDTSADRADA